MIIDLLKGWLNCRLSPTSIAYQFISSQAKFFAIQPGKKFVGNLADGIYTESLLDYFSALYYKIGGRAYDFFRGYGFQDSDMCVEKFNGVFAVPSVSTPSRRLIKYDFEM